MLGFTQIFGAFKRNKHSLEGFTIAGFSIALAIHSFDLIIHSLDSTRLAIINRFPFNPTYDWPIVLPRCLLARSDYWHVAYSSAVVLNFYITQVATYRESRS